MKILKKKISAFIFSITAVVMCLFCFVGCTKQFSFGGKWTHDEIVLSVGDSFNPNEYFEGEKNVSFISSDENVLVKLDKQTFAAQDSGRTTILAKSGDLLIDEMRVYVKYAFAAPTNLRVSNDGLLTWDDGSIFFDGQVAKPTYVLKIVGGGEENLVPCATNEYQFDEGGEYSVSVMSAAQQNVDASAFSSVLNFKFDLLEGASDFNFVSEESFGSQKGVFTWNGAQNGTLEIGGVKSEVSQGSAEQSFANFEEGSRINAKLVLSDESLGESKTIETTVEKLRTPIVQLKDGDLNWENVDAKKYLFKAEFGSNGEYEILSTTDCQSNLAGLGEGVYNLTYQAIGKTGYANGEVKYFPSAIGKIANVDTACERNGNKLKVTFSTTSEFNKTFVVKQNGQAKEFSFVGEKTNGRYVLIEEFDLEDGLNTFSVQALPTINGGVFNDP